MAKLIRGGRVILDHLDANLADIHRLSLQLSLAELKNNPYLTQDILNEIAALAKRSLHLIDTDLAPLLQRQERRVDGAEVSEIAEKIARIEHTLSRLARNQSTPD